MMCLYKELLRSAGPGYAEYGRLHVWIRFVAATLLTLPKLAPNRDVLLYAVVSTKVFSCSSGTFSGRGKNRTI